MLSISSMQLLTRHRRIFVSVADALHKMGGSVCLLWAAGR
jgi:hypothetical protein